MYRKRYMGDLPLLWGMNYNQLASDNPKIERICHYGRRTRKTNCTAAQRITMQTAPATKPWPKPLYQDTRPATICAPRGGQRCKPRPEPRRHHLPHAADTGHTSPQRRHQYKAPCIVPLPGAAAATYSHKPKPPCHVSIYDTKQGGFIFFIVAKIESGPNGIRVLCHQSASEQVGSMSAPDLCPQLTATETQSPPRFSLWGRSFFGFSHVASYSDAQERMRTFRQKY